MNDEKNDFSGDMVAKRRDDAIRRALNTPPQPLKDKLKKQPKTTASDDAAKPVRPKAS